MNSLEFILLLVLCGLALWFAIAASRCYTWQEQWVDIRELWDRFWRT